MDDLVLTLSARAMGTRFELVLVAPGARGLDAAARQRATSQLRAAGEAALEQIHDTERRWSLFLSTSRLTRLNQHGHETPLVLDEDDLELWSTVLEVHAASGGAFDPDVARAMHAAGFHDQPDRRAELGPRPELDEQPVRAAELKLQGRHLSLTAPGPCLDLGGVAKGHALDRAGRELSEAGVTCALLHGGTSSVLAIGAPPGQAAWQVRAPLVDPQGDTQGELTIALCDVALAASRSDSQRNAVGTGHILDPRTGRALAAATSSLVLAPSAALADAWATALCIDPTRRAAAEAMGAEVLAPSLADRPTTTSQAGRYEIPSPPAPSTPLPPQSPPCNVEP
ncbi:MAG: FAD:protein FMN transferase [Planctomycetota bacterium]|nr:FAD:protein FMN transferase [Planctomycetota bacterium]